VTARNDALAGAGRPGDELLDVIVIGGSQAGLAMAWHLARHHLRFTVLEAGPEIGHTWRSRWDSLTLFTPAQHNALPGMPFPGPPDTYPTKDPVAGYLKAYAAAFDLPVRLNARVIDLIRTAEGFEISSLRTGRTPSRSGSSDRSMSHCAYHDAQSLSAPSTIRKTWWWVSPASCSKPLTCSGVPVILSLRALRTGRHVAAPRRPLLTSSRSSWPVTVQGSQHMAVTSVTPRCSRQVRRFQEA